MCRNCIRLPNDSLDIPNHVSAASLCKSSYMYIILNQNTSLIHFKCSCSVLSSSVVIIFMCPCVKLSTSESKSETENAKILFNALVIWSCFSNSLQFVKTILSQGHLTPLPLYVSPVFWAFDYSMRVYPVPDVLIFADKYDPFSVTNTDCLCISPVRSRTSCSCSL